MLQFLHDNNAQRGMQLSTWKIFVALFFTFLAESLLERLLERLLLNVQPMACILLYNKCFLPQLSIAESEIATAFKGLVF